MQALEVDEADEAVPDLVERMTRLMQEARGVGLAAPQVGVLRRVLVYQTDDEEPVVALVNPRLTGSSEERESVDEGCLSLGAATVVVPVEPEGLEARVIQHELDHLDGVLILDRTTPEERRSALGQLRPQPILGPLV